MTQYSMTPINNGTRLRKGPSVWDDVIKSYNRGQLAVGDELWEAPADGPEVKKGDKWLHVTSVDGVPVAGWMAYIHKAQPVCNNFKEIAAPPPGVPPEFILEDPRDGKRALFVFSKLL